MKRAVLILAVFSSLVACAAEDSSEPENPPADDSQTVTPVQTPAPAASTTQEAIVAPVNEKRVVDVCAACGPLPDPWRELAGPLPDPWKSTAGNGAADPHK